MYCFHEGSMCSQEMCTIQKCSKWMSHGFRPHPTSPKGVGVWCLEIHALFSVGIQGGSAYATGACGQCY